MIYLLDTCVISELNRKPPNEGVTAWIKNADETTLFLSVLTIGEIKRGIEALTPSVKKESLEAFLDHQLLKRFAGRIYPIDIEVMISWGEMYASLVKSGQPLPLMDSLIAATARYHRAIIVTRNVDDFSPSGVKIINPWNMS